MAELIELQFGMLSWVGPGNIYYMGFRCPTWRGTFFGGDWPSIRNWALGKSWAVQKQTDQS